MVMVYGTRERSDQAPVHSSHNKIALIQNRPPHVGHLGSADATVHWHRHENEDLLLQIATRAKSALGIDRETPL